MSVSEDRKREIHRQQRTQRQNEAIKSQQVVDQQSYNDPFKYKAPKRSTLSSSKAATTSNDSPTISKRVQLERDADFSNDPVQLFSLPVRLYKLTNNQSTPTQLCRTTVTTPTNVDVMTHTISIIANNSEFESISMNFHDINNGPNKQSLVVVPIDSLFRWTLLPTGSNLHDLSATIGSFSHNNEVYGVFLHEIDALSRWILLSRYFSMRYEVSSQGLDYIDDLSQTIVPPLPSAPIIMDGDIVKVAYSLYAVNKLCDYVQATATGTTSPSSVNGSVLLQHCPSVMFTVGAGLCEIPGIENNVVGMRKRHVKALVIRRDLLLDENNEDWPISIRKGHFLLIEIAILNHRQSTEEASNFKSVVLDDYTTSTGANTTGFAAQQDRDFTAAPISKKTKPSQDADIKLKKGKKVAPKNKKGKKSAPFGGDSHDDKDSDDDLDHDDVDDDDDDDEQSKRVTTTKPTSKATSKSRAIQRNSSAESYMTQEEDHDGAHDNNDDDDDFEDDDEMYLKQSTQHPISNQLPIFTTPVNELNAVNVPPAVVSSFQQNQQNQQKSQNETTATATATADSKPNLAERMKRLAAGSGGSVAPTFNIATQQVVTSPVISSQPTPQSQQHYQQSPPQQHQAHHTSMYQQPTPIIQQQQQQQQQQHQYSLPQQTSSLMNHPITLNTPVSQLLFQLNLHQYTQIFAVEELLTVNDLLHLTEQDWASISMPTGVKRKVRTHIINQQLNNSSNSTLTVQPSTSFTPITTTNNELFPLLSPTLSTPSGAISPSSSQHRTLSQDIAVEEAYERGKTDAMKLCQDKIKQLKQTANERFTEQNQQMQQLHIDLAAVNAENQRNKEIVRTYVEKQRVQQAEQNQQMQLLQQQLVEKDQQCLRDIDAVKGTIKNEKMELLEQVYLSISTSINSNDVLDGQQVNKILKEVLKNLAIKK